jgi:hypothetical protein
VSTMILDRSLVRMGGGDLSGGREVSTM